MYDKMFRLATWMRDAGLPHDRRALTPMAMGGVYGLADIAALSADAKAADAVRCCCVAVGGDERRNNACEPAAIAFCVL